MTFHMLGKPSASEPRPQPQWDFFQHQGNFLPVLGIQTGEFHGILLRLIITRMQFINSFTVCMYLFHLPGGYMGLLEEFLLITPYISLRTQSPWPLYSSLLRLLPFHTSDLCLNFISFRKALLPCSFSSGPPGAHFPSSMLSLSCPNAPRLVCSATPK